MKTICKGCNSGLPLCSDGTHLGDAELNERAHGRPAAGVPCSIVARIRDAKESQGWTFRFISVDESDRIQEAARLTALGLTPYIIATDGTYKKPEFATEPPIWVIFTAERRPIPSTEPSRAVALDHFAQELFDRDYSDLDAVERGEVDARILQLGKLITGGSGQSLAMEVHAISTMPLVGSLARCKRFVAVKRAVMDGDECVGVMKSKSFAKRTANALNKHKTNSEGV